jgi:hypothetical protein
VKITETFELASAGRQLVVEIEIGGGRQDIGFRRVYDAGSEGG